MRYKKQTILSKCLRFACIIGDRSMDDVYGHGRVRWDPTHKTISDDRTQVHKICQHYG